MTVWYSKTNELVLLKFPLNFYIFMRLNTFADYDDEIANIDQKKVEVTDRG